MTVRDVKFYGAVGDGVANDTLAIQSVIDMSVPGDWVQIPTGRYVVDTLNYKPGVILTGDTSESTTLLANTDNSVVLNYLNGASYTEGFFIQDIGFNANFKTGVTFIKLDGLNSSSRIGIIRVIDVKFFGSAAAGLHLKFANGVFVQRAYAILPTVGFDIEQSSDVNLTDCSAVLGNGPGFRGTGVGGATPHDEGMRLTSCVTNGQSTGLWLDGKDWVVVTGCSFTTCNYAATVITSSHNLSFTGCEFAAAPNNYGFWSTNYCENVQITGCKFAINSFALICTGKGWAILGNTFWANTNVDIHPVNLTHSTVVGNACTSPNVWSVARVGITTKTVVASNSAMGLVN